MSDPLRTDGSRAFAAASEADREAKIEQLLLAGLDHYFAAQYDHAISVWTRVLFLDRSHARARAYIERGRSALAERQRESEELLQSGVAAFQRGDSREARRLVQAAIDGGAPTDEALAVLDRLNRLGPAPAPDLQAASRRPPREAVPSAARFGALWVPATALTFVVALAAAGAYSAARWPPPDWRALFPLQSAPARTVGTPVVREAGLAPPRRGELALARARALAADGHLRDALTALDLVRPTDPQKTEADRLRGEIQLQLIALTSVPAQAADKAAAAAPGNRPLP
jgi:tetratricopeptide (TPR) repeat protein